MLVIGLSHCPGILELYKKSDYEIEGIFETPNLNLIFYQMIAQAVPYFEQLKADSNKVNVPVRGLSKHHLS